ncbi:MAG: hypothetical protein ACKORK_12275, partial [Gemmatimonadota bacterium]
DTLAANQGVLVVSGTFQSLEMGDYPHFNMLTNDGREVSFFALSISPDEMARFEQEGMCGTPVQVQWRRSKRFIPEADEEMEIDELVSVAILDAPMRECSYGLRLVPEIDLNAKKPHEADSSGRGVAGGAPSGRWPILRAAARR